MTQPSSPHLIVIRGNSSSGKSTLATELQHRLGRGVANVGQDHLRRVVLREHDVPDGDNIALIEQTVRHCLAIPYHVIVEGILHEPHYGPMLRRLLDEHAGPSQVFYLDVPFEATVERHRTKDFAAAVSTEQLRSWYHDRDLLGVPGEVVIDASRPSAEVLSDVLERIGPVDPSLASLRDGARFL